MVNHFLPKHVALFFLNIMLCWLIATFSFINTWGLAACFNSEVVLVLERLGNPVCNLDICRHLKDDGRRFDKIFTLLSVPNVPGSDVSYG